MKFFIDTANVDEIRKANDMGVICGVTTNPSLIAKEGKDYVETLKEIASIVDGPISGEVKATTTDAEGMIAEGREIAKIHPNMVVKIPMTIEGLKATKVLASEGIKVNVTLIFSANQALLAARAGAAYVSPFLGRLDDISQPGIDLIDTVAEIFALHDIETEIIAASVRHTMHVTECALAGADIATVPYKVIELVNALLAAHRQHLGDVDDRAAADGHNPAAARGGRIPQDGLRHHVGGLTHAVLLLVQHGTLQVHRPEVGLVDVLVGQDQVGRTQPEFLHELLAAPKAVQLRLPYDFFHALPSFLLSLGNSCSSPPDPS